MKAAKVLFITVIVIAVFVSSAFADFDVSVDSKLADIALSVGDSTIVIQFKDGVATWLSDEGEKIFCGFYTEEALQKLTGKRYTASAIGVTPNVGNIYLVVRNCYTKSEKDAYYAWPIQFSAFGIGIRYDGGKKICHNGLAIFGSHAITMVMK